MTSRDVATRDVAARDVAAREVAAEIVRVAQQLRARGLAIGTSGNVGARLGDGRIAITPSSLDYDEMTPNDVVVGADGQVRPDCSWGGAVRSRSCCRP